MLVTDGTSYAMLLSAGKVTKYSNFPDWKMKYSDFTLLRRPYDPIQYHPESLADSARCVLVPGDANFKVEYTVYNVEVFFNPS